MALQKLSPERLDTSAGIILTPASTPSAPVEGQMYYDSTSDQVQFYNGTEWGSMGGVEGITDNSDAVAMTIDSAEKIGIGITAPDSRLEVKDKIKVSSTTTNPLFDLDNQTTNGKNWRMQAESGDGAFTFKNATDNTTAYQINTSGEFLGLDINGDVTITGDLAISGTTTTTNSTSLLVEDKNIELGKVATPTDTTADGGGITLKGTTDKTITWVDANDAWSFNQGIKFTDGTSSLSGSFLQETTTTIEGTVSEQKLLMADSATLSGNLTVNDRLVLTQMQDDKYGLDAHVKLLIHSDTTDASTTFTDSSRFQHPITTVGGAQHKTAQQQFGATSMYFDGRNSGDYLTIPAISDLVSVTGDFTIDTWIKRNSGSNPPFEEYVVSNMGSTDGFYIYWQTNGYIYLGQRVNGSEKYKGFAPGVDTDWHHLAIVRSAGTYTFYWDGVTQAILYDDMPTSYGTEALGTTTADLTIGAKPTTLSWAGYIDEFRFSHLARWTENFTVPYKAYQDSTPALLTGGYTITGSGTIENGLIDSTDQWEGSTYINTLGTILKGELTEGVTGTLGSGVSKSPCGVRCWMSGSATVGDNGTIPFDSVGGTFGFDTHSAFSNNKWTVPAGHGGTYLIIAKMTSNTGGSNRFIGNLWNGTVGSSIASLRDEALEYEEDNEFSSIVQLSAGDEIYMRNGSGASRDFLGYENNTQMHIIKLG